MHSTNRSVHRIPHGLDRIAVSLRVVVASSVMAMLGAFSASSRAADDARWPLPQGLPPDVRERMEKSREFSERMHTAAAGG